MSLSLVIDELKKSGFSCLVANKRILGVRAKIFDEPTRKFKYFDFDVNTLNKENKAYIQSRLASLPKEQLIDKGNMWVTKAEIENQIVITEIEDTNEINKLVSQIITIHRELESV